MRLCLANLSAPPSSMLAGSDPLAESQREWTQDLQYYTVFYYHHTNIVFLSGQSFAVETGDMIIVGPGTRAGHAKIGSESMCEYLTFNLPGKRPAEVSLPVYLSDRSDLLADLVRATERIGLGIEPVAAFVWNFLWSVAQPTSQFREQEVLYRAEEFVRRNLDRRFSVAEMAEFCGSNHRKLLAAFRQEHRVSIQEYVLRTRIQEASRLLLNTSLTVKEIATKVGYVDLQEFNKVMRAGTGASPRRYREGTR